MLKRFLMDSVEDVFGKRLLPLTCFILCIPLMHWSVVVRAESDGCTELKAVMEYSQNDFKDHRTGPKYFNKVTIWDTDIVLAGQECQVWQWGGGNYSYVCTRNFPLKEAGINFNRKAVNTIKACFKEELTITDNALPVKNGYYTQVRAKTDGRRIDLFLVENSGLFKDSWTYYFMATGSSGYPLQSLQDGLGASSK